MKKWIERLTYKRKILAFSILVSLVPILLLGWFFSMIFGKYIQEEVDRNHSLVLNQVNERINRFIYDLDIASISLSSNTVVGEAVKRGPDHYDLTQDAMKMVRHQKRVSPINYHSELIYLNHDYIFSTISQTSSYEGTVFEEILEEYKPVTNRSYVITPHTFPNQADLILIRPVPLSTIYTEGMIALHVNERDVHDLIRDFGETTPHIVYVIDDLGRIVISQWSDEIGLKLAPSSDLYRYWENPDQYGNQFVLNRKEYVLTTKKAEFADWTYIVMTPKSHLTAKSNEIQWITWVISLVFIIIFVMIILFGSRKLYQPIGKLFNQSLQRSGRAGQPIKNEFSVLDKAFRDLSNDNTGLREILNEHTPFIRGRVFHSIITGELNETQVNRLSKHFDIPNLNDRFFIGLIQVDQLSHFQQKYSEKDRYLIYYAMRKMVEELLEEINFTCLTFITNPGQLVLLIPVKNFDLSYEQVILEKMDQFRLHALNYFQFSVSIAIDKTAGHYTSISSAYYKTRDLLEYRMVLGDNITLSEGILKSMVNHTNQQFIQRHKNIVHFLIQGSMEEAVSELQTWTHDIRKQTFSAETARGMYSHLLGEIGFKLFEAGDESHSEFQEEMFKTLYHMRTTEEIQVWMIDIVFPEVISRMKELKTNKKEWIVQQAISYIQDHYQTDLSLQNVADMFHISPSFLSRMFKEETGESFSDYLTKFRMEQAKRWLENTDMMISSIADKLAYSNVQNFSRSFKQLHGIPPGEYREKSRK